jgi:hypothetical protein
LIASGVNGAANRPQSAFRLNTARLPSPASPSRRPSRTCVERKALASGIFPSIHVNHLDGLWLGSQNERIVVQQQNRFDYPHELAARHRFWHRDRYGQAIRGKAAIPDQDITCQLFVFLKECVNAHVDCLKRTHRLIVPRYTGRFLLSEQRGPSK